MDFSTLFGSLDLVAAVSGLLSNPLVVTGLTIVLGARIAPVLITFIKRAVSR